MLTKRSSALVRRLPLHPCWELHGRCCPGSPWKGFGEVGPGGGDRVPAFLVPASRAEVCNPPVVVLGRGWIFLRWFHGLPLTALVKEPSLFCGEETLETRLPP